MEKTETLSGDTIPQGMEKAMTPLRGVKRVVFPIVRSDRPVEERVKGFNYVNPNITSQNFTVAPLAGPKPEEAVLSCFGEYVESEEAVEWLNGIGIRPGLLTELVDLSNSHPNSEFLSACLPVIALGDFWVDPRGNRHVGFLDGSAGRRGLYLPLRSRTWSYRWCWLLGFYLPPSASD